VFDGFSVDSTESKIRFSGENVNNAILSDSTFIDSEVGISIYEDQNGITHVGMG
jgi:hypothetical protein